MILTKFQFEQRERQGFVMSWTKFVCGLLAVSIIEGVACGEGFSWKDTEGKYLDLLYDGRKVTRQGLHI